VLDPAEATTIDISDFPLTRFDVDLAELEPGGPTPVPWTEFEQYQAQHTALLLHVGARAFPTNGYPHEVGVWPTGVVWFTERGVWFRGWDGEVVKVKAAPPFALDLTFGPRNLYYVKRRALMSLSARHLTPRTELDAAEAAGLPDDSPRGSVSIVGLLDAEDPMVKVSYWRKGVRSRLDPPPVGASVTGRTIEWLYSAGRGVLPLRPEWTYVPSPVSGILLASDPSHTWWAAFDSEGMRPLWTHEFVDRDGYLLPPQAVFTPSGRKVILWTGPRHQVIVLDAATGNVEQRIWLPYDSTFDSDSTFVYTAYDGPPNPAYDPNNPYQDPSDIEWPNVIVRCSLEGNCEQAARVDPPRRSLRMSSTVLFPARS